MILKVRVVPGARKRRIEEVEGVLKVYVPEPAVEGKANSAMIELLARHLGVKKSHIKLVRGEHSREKLVEVKKYFK